MNLYAEWSTNETCSFQACMGASSAKIRSLCVAKQNGILYIGDALYSAALSGCRGGFVLIAADDPGAHSSTNEFDSRNQARSAAIPMLEPATYQEAKDMVRWAFDLSEELQQVVMVRGVTRIHHGRGNVVLGELPAQLTPPSNTIDPIIARNPFHGLQLEKLEKARKIFEESGFNWYVGPEKPELLIITSGIGWLYSSEAVSHLGTADRVGILKLGCTWPLPEKLVLKHLATTKKVLVIEEVDPFLEQNIGDLAGHHGGLELEISGRSRSAGLPNIGELTPDIVSNAVAAVLKIESAQPGPLEPEDQAVVIPQRELTFCAGCPHRASFYVLKQSLALLGKGLVMGDIGCYTLGVSAAGYFGVQGLSCMGGGINMAEGLGQLSRFGFDQPVIALAGDSTFFHSCIPGLVNARFQNANMMLVVLDNSATAMTGFQPHPGTGNLCMGQTTDAISVEAIAEAIGCSVTIADPYELDKTIETVYRLLKQSGVKVLVLRRECATLTTRTRGKQKVTVDRALCRAEECGCNNYCSRVWGCPGNIFDYETQKATIDEVLCIGCGVCAEICPAGAIKVEGGALS
jgi:indolepyruvate ferredoxin oxidoreductase alpha subunit